MVNTLIFDCDGVLADTERFGHLPAFNQTFEEFGLPVHWSEEEYAEKVKIGGGKERMASLLTDDFVRQAHLPLDTEGQKNVLAQWHKRKTAIFKEIIAEGRLPGRPGIARIANEAIANNWKLAVASTSVEESVRAILEHAVGKESARHFEVFAGDIISKKKPAPDIYVFALEHLHATPQETLVIEDSRQGLLAAVGAGLRCVVTLSSYTTQEDLHEAVMVVSQLGDPGNPAQIIANRGRATPGPFITLSDLQACLEP